MVPWTVENVRGVQHVVQINERTRWPISEPGSGVLRGTRSWRLSQSSLTEYFTLGEQQVSGTRFTEHWEVLMERMRIQTGSDITVLMWEKEGDAAVDENIELSTVRCRRTGISRWAELALRASQWCLTVQKLYFWPLKLTRIMAPRTVWE